MVFDFEVEWILNGEGQIFKEDFDLVGKDFIHFDTSTKPFGVHGNGNSKKRTLRELSDVFKDFNVEGVVLTYSARSERH